VSAFVIVLLLGAAAFTARVAYRAQRALDGLPAPHPLDAPLAAGLVTLRGVVQDGSAPLTLTVTQARGTSPAHGGTRWGPARRELAAGPMVLAIDSGELVLLEPSGDVRLRSDRRDVTDTATERRAIDLVAVGDRVCVTGRLHGATGGERSGPTYRELETPWRLGPTSRGRMWVWTASAPSRLRSMRDAALGGLAVCVALALAWAAVPVGRGELFLAFAITKMMALGAVTVAAMGMPRWHESDWLDGPEDE
jgi:hypothetical protein